MSLPPQRGTKLTLSYRQPIATAIAPPSNTAEEVERELRMRVLELERELAEAGRAIAILQRYVCSGMFCMKLRL